jgi:peptide/nickel transport system permease protein
MRQTSLKLHTGMAGGSPVWRCFLALEPQGIVSGAYLLAIIVLTLAAPTLMPYSPSHQDLSAALSPPSMAHLLGTDDLGRDTLTRLFYGAANSLYATFLATVIAAILGVPIGLILGLAEGWLDEIGSRLVDTMLSFPAIVLAIGVTGILGIGLTNAMISVGIVFTPVLARLMRAQTIIAKQALYVQAARSFGATRFTIVVRHILPNAIQPVLVQLTLLLAIGLVAEASLSFLGLGVQPPNVSWGAMLSEAYSYMEMSPYLMYPPGFAIMVTALAFSSFGEALRRALDPTRRRRQVSVRNTSRTSSCDAPV